MQATKDEIRVKLKAENLVEDGIADVQIIDPAGINLREEAPSKKACKVYVQASS